MNNIEMNKVGKMHEQNCTALADLTVEELEDVQAYIEKMKAKRK